MTDPDRGLHVLLVEDNDADALLVEDLLGAGQGQVSVGRTTRLSQAVEQLSEQQYSCVLLDLGLPDSVGIDTLAKLRSENATVPVIVLTGRDDEELGLEALREGAQEYLVKGQVNERLLRRAIGYAIERKKLDEAKSQFIARAAHELRTPLAVLAGLAETIATSSDDVGPVRMTEILGALERQAARARTLIAQLLDLSQAELGRVHLRQQRLDAATLVAATLEAAPPPDGVSVQTDAPGGLAVTGDQTRVEQILVNLLTNAYKYGGSGITVTAEPRDDGAAIAVTDDGPGMSDDVREHLFEPFVRGPTTQDGAGLGLAICRRLAEAMGGTLDFDAEAAGTRFVLTLPG